MRSTHPRGARRAAAVLLVAGAALLAGASSASAHAQLEGSDPGSGEVLAAAPRHVTLTFGESVEPAANAIAVFDDHLRPVRTGPVVLLGGESNRLSVSLAGVLARGTYTVSWRVSSADTHPVFGSFQFSVGARSAVTGRVPGTAHDDLAGFLLGVTRGVGSVGLALGPGMLLVVLGLWNAGLSDQRTKRMLWIGLGLLVTSTLGGMLFQGVWASGRPLSAIWSSPGALDTHSRRFDQLYAVRFYLVVAFGIALAALFHRQVTPPSDTRARRGPVPGRGAAPISTADGGDRWVLPLAVSVSAMLMATWALAGHASTGPASSLAVGANLVHLMALSTWLGGLALVAVCLRPASRAADLAAVMPRFSRLAFGCVVVVVLTGSFMAWREVGSIAALRSTEYGRLLLVKLIGVVALIALGNLARHWVRRHLSSGPRRPALLPFALPFVARGIVPVQGMVFRPQEYGEPELVRLHRGVFAELGVAATVLALTSALVVVVPARQDFVAPFHHTVTTAALRVDLDLASPRVGDAVLRVTVHATDGRPAPLTAVRGSITLASAHLGPLALQPVSTNGASKSGTSDLKVTLPARGTWTVNLTVQTSPLDATALSAQLAVS